ncbi:hypothetical protein CR513_44727, partial [Mucuna pruriens]
MSITRHQTSLGNGRDENTLQQLLRVVTSLQEKSEEQTHLNAEATRRYEEAEKRYEEAMRRVGEHELKLREQLDALKMIVERVTNLFDIKQIKSESLKQYLACFNSATIQVDNQDKKFFMKAFQKGLRVVLSGSLDLRKPASIGEIRARVEKYVEAKEGKKDQL